MKQTVLFFWALFSILNVGAQQPFIKKMDTPDYGKGLRILPASNHGWVLFSKDSLKLTKFNSCGLPDWSRRYNLPNTHNSLSDIIRTPSGGYVILTRMNNGSRFVSVVTSVGASGQIIWSKSYEEIIYDQFPYTINADRQGNLFVFANLDHTSNPLYNLVFKLDSNGNLIWSKVYDHGGIWGGAIVTEDQGMLVRTGSTFIKTDLNGFVQWTSSVYSPTYSYLAPVEVSDGYIYTAYANTTYEICFFKLGKQGQLLWNGFKKSDFTGIPPSLYRKSNGNIAGLFNRSDAGLVYPTLIEFDNNLQVVHQSALDNIQSGLSQTGTDMVFLDNNMPVVAGMTGQEPFIARLTDKFESACSKFMPMMTNDVVSCNMSQIGTIALSFDLTVVDHVFLSDTFSITLSPVCKQQKFLDIGNDTSLCNGNVLNIYNRSGDTFDHYSWSTGETTQSISVAQSGKYWLAVFDECNEEVWTDTIEVTMLSNVLAELGNEVFLCEGIPVVLHAPDCDSCTYNWNTGSMNDSLKVTQEGIYWLMVDNRNGCTSVDSIFVDEVKCNCTIYIPNAFTPNADGRNETFRAEYDCEIENFNFSIFNRWGEMVFESKVISGGWSGSYNGQKVPEGTYVYVIKYTPVIKGKTSEPATKTGTVAVIY